MGAALASLFVPGNHSTFGFLIEVTSEQDQAKALCYANTNATIDCAWVLWFLSDSEKAVAQCMIGWLLTFTSISSMDCSDANSL